MWRNFCEGRSRLLENTRSVKRPCPAVRYILLALGGAAGGFLNGFLGSGGGIILIFAMTYLCDGLDTKERFSTAVASVLPMSAVSAVMYIKSGSLSLAGQARLLIPGALGGLFGAFIMDKISPKALKLIFSALMVFAGVRMIMPH